MPIPTPPSLTPPLLGAGGPTSAAPPNLPFRGDPAQQGREVASPGPRTDAGKAIAARNATTHGLFARDIVLPDLGEDPAAFDALLQQLGEQLPPRNLLERHYLEQIAAASWRLRRLHRWQAQVYEDPAITEDQRLDKLDKVLRHEIALTRQIDRAIRTLNRDLKWLFESRARAEALYQRDLTENEIRQEPELDIEVQRLVWRQLRPTPPPDLGDARLDTQVMPQADNSDAPPASQICQNELPTPCDNKNCENEPPAEETTQDDSPPLARFRTGGPGGAERGPGGEGRSMGPGGEGHAPRQGRLDPNDEIAYRKREQEIYRQYHPHAAKEEIDWDSEEVRQVYGAAGRPKTPPDPKLSRPASR